MKDDEAEAIRAQDDRYMRALHAMQSGIKQAMEIGATSTEPKHLRVGVSSALIDSAAIASLLIKKGIITELEYRTELADLVEDEVKTYEDRLSQHFGNKITLA